MYADAIKESFQEVMAQFNGSSAMQKLSQGKLNIRHYKSMLREIFHYSREDPQIQALATVFFRGADRGFVRPFLKHAIVEIGHDQLALADLAALGEDTTDIVTSNPLPSTMALISFPFYQITYLNPVGYLGYLYFLEHMPTQEGQQYAAALAQAGIPATAMRFLREHVTVDVGHNKWMQQYIDGLIRTEQDLDSVVYAMRTTGQLYGQMLDGAVRQTDNPEHYGCARHELRGIHDPGAFQHAGK